VGYSAPNFTNSIRKNEMTISQDTNVVVFTVNNAPLLRAKRFENSTKAAIFARTIIEKGYRVIRIDSIATLMAEAIAIDTYVIAPVFA
jgi:hypothetical protein